MYQSSPYGIQTVGEGGQPSQPGAGQGHSPGLRLPGAYSGRQEVPFIGTKYNAKHSPSILARRRPGKEVEGH